jgi:hypothetical protein
MKWNLVELVEYYETEVFVGWTRVSLVDFHNQLQFFEIGALSQGNKFCNKVCLSFVNEKVFRSFTTAVGGFKSGSFVFFIDDFLSDVRFAFARRTCNGF